MHLSSYLSYAYILLFTFFQGKSTLFLTFFQGKIKHFLTLFQDKNVLFPTLFQDSTFYSPLSYTGLIVGIYTYWLHNFLNFLFRLYNTTPQ